MPTVKEVTYNLLRRLGLTTVVGNPGSTEETFLKDFPQDFTYVLALQEASAVAIADGLAQGSRRPVLVNVHTAAGLGNGMGTLITAFQNKTPLIVTAGQQTREMLMLEPLLTNIDAVTLPRPWVKWSCEPARPEDVPAAFMRAYATAVQPPAGPVFLSLPLDDWDKEMADIDVHRTVCTRVAPDPLRLAEFARIVDSSRTPLLIYGADLARSAAWDEGIRLAERLGAPVAVAPFAERTPFPETHPLYAGVLPAAVGPLSRRLEGHDLVLVVGAPVFRYYPWVPGDYLPQGTRLLQVSDDPGATAKAPVGDSLLSDALLFLEALTPLVTRREGTPSATPLTLSPPPRPAGLPLSPDEVFEVIRSACPAEYVLVNESPSNVAEMFRHFRIDRPDTFYTFASGALGWGMPASVGLALAEKQSGRGRPVLAVMGDGSFQYSPQSVYTAVQHGAHVIFLVLCNAEYAILKEFAELECTPHVPGLDLPGLDIVSLGRGYGAGARRAETADEIREAFQAALDFEGASVIEIPTTPGLRPLLA